MEKRKIPNLSRQPTDSSTKGVELKINVSFKNWWLEKFKEIPQILKIQRDSSDSKNPKTSLYDSELRFQVTFRSKP